MVGDIAQSNPHRSQMNYIFVEILLLLTLYFQCERGPLSDFFLLLIFVVA